MTVLFAGGEDTSVQLFNTIVNSNTLYSRSSYTRNSFNPNTINTSATIVNGVVTPLFTPTTSLWGHCQYYSSNTSIYTANAILFAFFDASGVMRIAVRVGSTSQQLKISTCNASGTFVDLVSTSTTAFYAGGPFAFDIFVNYSTTGQVTIYWQGILLLDTGSGVNVTTNGVTSLAQFYMGSNASGVNVGISEIVVQTTSTLGIALFTMPPLAVGNTQSWTGNVGNINKSVISDSTYNNTSSNNALSEWTVTTTLPPGGWAIEAVVQEARVSVGTTGPQHFAWVVRTSDGSDNTTGSISVATSLTNYNNQIWATNPHTGSAWNAGELINAGIESLA